MRIQAMEVVSTSIAGAPDIVFKFRADTCEASLAGAVLVATAGRESTELTIHISGGFQYAALTVHPREGRTAAENLVEIGSALLWSHWRWAVAKREEEPSEY